jgi:hypothetical protein
MNSWPSGKIRMSDCYSMFNNYESTIEEAIYCGWEKWKTLSITDGFEK